MTPQSPEGSQVLNMDSDSDDTEVLQFPMRNLRPRPIKHLQVKEVRKKVRLKEKGDLGFFNNERDLLSTLSGSEQGISILPLSPCSNSFPKNSVTSCCSEQRTSCREKSVVSNRNAKSSSLFRPSFSSFLGVLLLGICCVVVINPVLVTGELHGGVVTVPLVLDRVDQPYYIREDVIVAETGELIIRPGVQMLFSPAVGITVFGRLIAEVRGATD